MLYEIQILVSSADTPFRKRLCHFLRGQPNMSVIGEHSSGKDTLSALRHQQPDVLLVDLLLEDMSAFDLLHQLDGTRIMRAIILGEQLDVQDQTQAALWGACGAIEKTSATEMLFKCIRSVVSGELWFDRNVMKELVARRGAGSPDDSVPRQNLEDRLTKREMDVLRGVADGMSNQQMSAQLRISESTIKHHLTRIFSKLHLSSRLELALLASKYGLGTKAEALIEAAQLSEARNF